MKKLLTAVLFFLTAVVSAEAQEVCTRDSIFPDAGNCGYDVQDYQMDMAWDPDGDTWNVSEVVSFTSEWDTDELWFDFTDTYKITSISVDGTSVEYERRPTKLIVHYHFAHETEYKLYAAFNGKLQWGELFDPEGKTRSPEDGFCMINEPTNAWRFYICNDHPKDKATYHYSFTVPANYVPAGSGRLLMIREASGTVILPGKSYDRSWDPDASEGTVTFTFEQAADSAPYLFTVCAGAFDLKLQTVESGRVQLDFVDREHEDADLAWKLTELQEEIIAAESAFFGDYPYDDSGAIVSKTHIGAALETQGRALYDAETTADRVFAHEITHQWMGDLISLEDWSDLWIKEGAASFGEAIWREHTEGKEGYENCIRNFYEEAAFGRHTMLALNKDTLELLRLLNDDPGDTLYSHDKAVSAIACFCSIPRADVRLKDGDVTYAEWEEGLQSNCGRILYGRQTRNVLLDMLYAGPEGAAQTARGPKEIGNDDIIAIYGAETYYGGAVVYHSLRYKLGDQVFSQALQTLLEENRWGTVSEEKFIDAFSRAAGEDLSDFIRSYLYYSELGHIPDLIGIETWAEAAGMFDPDLP